MDDLRDDLSVLIHLDQDKTLTFGAILLQLGAGDGFAQPSPASGTGGVKLRVVQFLSAPSGR